MKYIGITIGPIFKTIDEAISPAGLWFASTFFSELSKRLCRNIKNKIDNVSIFSPYFEESDIKNDGIGRFHDRILFRLPHFEKEKLDFLILKTKLELRELLDDTNNENDKDSIDNFLKNYFHVEYVVFEESQLGQNNVVASLNGALDSLELMMVNQKQDVHNLFQKYFLGEEENRNVFVKKSGLFKGITEDNFLVIPQKNELKSIESIISSDNEQSLPYFAVVNSDGDKVGRLLSQICEKDGEKLSLEEQIKKVESFSKSCMSYSHKAAKYINDNDGMTIYAGGDDLLFIAPIVGLNHLLESLNTLFIETFVNNEELGFSKVELENLGLSLSFGVTIQYKKFPLYETLAQARLHLYKAKNNGGNRSSFFVQKHSGQFFELILLNDQLRLMSELSKKIHSHSQILESIGYKLGELKPVVELLFQETVANQWKQTQFFERFVNHFDNINQLGYMDYIKSLSDFYYDNYLMSGDDNVKPSVEHFQTVIRFINFGKGALSYE